MMMMTTTQMTDDEYDGLETQMRLESLVCFFVFQLYSTNIYLQINYAMVQMVGQLQKKAQVILV